MTNMSVFWLPDRSKATVSKVACMGRIVKMKIDTLIGSNFSNENVLGTATWEGYQTYATNSR